VPGLSDDSALLTVEEVAQLLKVHENTVRIWLRSSQLAGIRLGREWRITRADLDRFLADRRQERQ
jgi:excisionase family DNA binding protein